MNPKPKPYLKDIQTNRATSEAHIRMIAWRFKFDNRRYIWIIRREHDGKSVRQSRVHLHSRKQKSLRIQTRKLTVSVGPSIVPTHSNRLPSLFGNADCSNPSQQCQ